MTEHDQGVICELLEHRGKLKIALLNIMNAGNANPESIRKIIADAIKATDCKEYDEHGGVLGFIDVNHASTL
ncbi:MAG TPA: hypothetical protein VJ961_09835 [Mariprofundaceae bacterium]|nr:hypothetical protein [Mariprofundaceae bacterium]